MGLIQIRNRSERLGNIGGVRGVANDIGADRAILAMSRADRQIDAARGDIADAAIGGAKDILKLGIDLVKDREKKRRADAEEAERLQREQDGEDADRFVAAYQKAMSEYDNGSVDAQGNITPGAMQADISDAGEWISGNVKYRSDLAGKLRKELNLSGNAYEMAKKRLAGFDLSMQNRWQARAFEFNDAAAKSAANERLNAANVTLLNMPQLGTGTSGDGDAAYIAAWAEWNDATENALDKNHVTESGARKAARREMAQKFVGAALQNKLSALSQGTEGMERKEIETAFSDYEDRVAEGVDGIVPSELRNANGDVLGDFLKTDLEGVDLESFKNAALKDIRREKTHALARADAREREAKIKVLDDFDKKEYEIISSGENRELLAEQYEKLSSDENLVKYSPKTAKACLEKARALRAAEKREAELEAERARRESAAQEKAVRTAELARERAQKKADRDSIVTMEAEIIRLRADGSAESRKAAARLETDLFHAVQNRFGAGQLDADEYTGYMRRRKQSLTEDECRAMARFHRMIGLGAELDSSGKLTAGSRKSILEKGEVVLSPIGAHDKGWGVDSDKLLEVGDRLLSELRSLPKDVNREEIVSRAAAEMFSYRAMGDVLSNVSQIVERAAAVQRAETGQRTLDFRRVKPKSLQSRMAQAEIEEEDKEEE